MISHKNGDIEDLNDLIALQRMKYIYTGEKFPMSSQNNYVDRDSYIILQFTHWISNTNYIRKCQHQHPP